jgi:hypothetical protein
MIYNPVKGNGGRECTVGYFRNRSAMWNTEVENEVCWLIWENVSQHLEFLRGALDEDGK